MNPMEMRFTIDINGPLISQEAKTLMVEGDRYANTIRVEALENGAPADLTGCTVAAYMIRADGHKAFTEGYAAGNIARVTLNDGFYAVPGRYNLFVRLTHTDGTKRTILWLNGWVSDEGQGDVIDTGGVVPSLDDLLAQITVMDRAVDTSTPPIIMAAEGTTISATDAGNRPLYRLRIFGRTTQEGTPTPEAPGTLSWHGSGGGITFALDDGKEAQYATFTPVDGLHGIPVASGGTYTDAKGQEWIADEINAADGRVLERIHAVRLTSTSHVWNAGAVAGRFNTNNPNPGMLKGTAPMCSHFVGTADFSTIKVGMVCNNGGAQIVFATNFASLAEWKAWLDANEVWLLYAKATADADLPADEIATYKALRPASTNVSMYTDAGAWMQVEYVADTEAFIRRAIAEALAGK